MSDVSKYRNLPGIAFDQPDVYETNDLPEVDQINRRAATVYDGDQTDNVSIIAVKPEQAYDAFKDKVVDGSQVDFREPIAKQRPLGYQSFGDWEIVDSASRDRETPLQKYRRIQAEAAELIEGLRAAKQPSADSASKVVPTFGNELTPCDIVTGLDQLTEQLKSLNVEQWAESNILYGVESSKIYSKLCSQVEGLKESQQKDEKSASKSEAHSFTYQLLCDPQLSRNREMTRLNLIEQRIKRLESLLGNDDQKISFLTNLTNDKSLVEAVNLMSARISQMDSSHLESIEARLKSLLNKLNQMSEKKAQLEDIEKQNKIDELYEIVMKNEKRSASMPLIATRLNALNDLQEQGKI
ncbi:Dynactin subunit 2-A-like protein [Dinothrombium tinctorium]|uniref:Dynactin subunit 2-A-like protein n=1 Tax=Dinothrombium tinctorium TaxID=1965070 RepID=A0A443RPA4_9ACAR|nr:Dynactin subunit 2-A-like protein [Dinothrombium tinctorium]